MDDESKNEQQKGDIPDIINSVTELAKEVPVYQDAIQPVAKEVGKALQTVGMAVNAALLPIRGLVWGVDQIEDFIQSKVSERLKNIPPENIQTPDLAVAGPALESLRYVGHKESLSDLYANLLASSMDIETAKAAHPGFVEIIRNLSSDEAKILEFLYINRAKPVIDIRRRFRNDNRGSMAYGFVSCIGAQSGCDHPELTPTYFTNLERLGLIGMDKGRYLATPGAYDEILNDFPVKKLIEEIDAEEEYQSEVVKYYVDVTPLGRQFGDACIANKKQRSVKQG